MRFMIMHKNDPRSEAGEKPPMELVQKMGEFIGGHAKAGTLIDGAGLGASATRTRLTFRDGACTVKHGPYRGEHELPSTMLPLPPMPLSIPLGVSSSLLAPFGSRSLLAPASVSRSDASLLWAPLPGPEPLPLLVPVPGPPLRARP